MKSRGWRGGDPPTGALHLPIWQATGQSLGRTFRRTSQGQLAYSAYMRAAQGAMDGENGKFESKRMGQGYESLSRSLAGDQRLQRCTRRHRSVVYVAARLVRHALFFLAFSDVTAPVLSSVCFFEP